MTYDLTERPSKTIGPFVAGEVPGWHSHQFLYDDGTPIDTSVFDAHFVYARVDPLTLEVVDGDEHTMNVGGSPETYPRSEGWVHFQWERANFDTPGHYVGRFWVWHHGANPHFDLRGTAYASPLFHWVVHRDPLGPPQDPDASPIE